MWWRIQWHLSKYIKQNPSVLGTNSKSDELPILIKLIDAEDNLSVQVHPDDEMALRLENQNGKTEMWYVVEASDDAKIIFGVKEDISKDELKSAISSNTVEDLLNSVTSKKGDVFFCRSRNDTCHRKRQFNSRNPAEFKCYISSL